MGGLSRKQVYEIAEQILTGSKSWDDFKGIEDEDRARVEVLLKRGLRALGEAREATKLPAHAQTRLKRKAASAQYVFVSERKKPHFLSQSAGIGFEPIDMRQLCAESLAVKRLAFEALHRRLTAKELTLWISTLDLEQWSAVKEALPERIAEEWEQRVALLADETVSFEEEAVWAKASIILVGAMKEAPELQESTQKDLRAYEESLKRDLQSYCKELPGKMGLLKHLDGFSNQQWTRLAGFTPRSDLACMMEFLPQDIIARLLSPLPAAQKQDVAETLTFHRGNREREIRAYGEVIGVLKKWAATVDKVLRLPIDP